MLLKSQMKDEIIMNIGTSSMSVTQLLLLLDPAC
jgi:hypothetical protein